jgi:hypothetical protein
LLLQIDPAQAVRLGIGYPGPKTDLFLDALIGYACIEGGDFAWAILPITHDLKNRMNKAPKAHMGNVCFIGCSHFLLYPLI